MNLGRPVNTFMEKRDSNSCVPMVYKVLRTLDMIDLL
jgi:hypothetical protein